MDFSINRNLPSMKYSKDQEVYFEYENERKRGVIDILDFGVLLNTLIILMIF